MTEQGMAARLIVLETICKAGFGILFALSGKTDPGHTRAIATLDAIRETARHQLGASGDTMVRNEGEAYLDELLSEFSGNLGKLRQYSSK
jgi:hypothetical protein